MQQWTLCRNLYYFVHHYLQGRPGGVVVYQYTQKTFAKIPQNTQNSSKIYPKLYPGILYTWNSKKVIYRIPVFKLQYTVYPIYKAPVYCIPINPGWPYILQWVYCINISIVVN